MMEWYVIWWWWWSVIQQWLIIIIHHHYQSSIIIIIDHSSSSHFSFCLSTYLSYPGEPVSKTDMWEFDGGQRSRHRFEHSHLTVGMWATAAFAAVGGKGAKSYSDELLKVCMYAYDFLLCGAGLTGKAFDWVLSSLFSVPTQFYEGKDYFGVAVDPTGFNEDIAHNEMYFDQFLAWFGASLIGGRCLAGLLVMEWLIDWGTTA